MVLKLKQEEKSEIIRESIAKKEYFKRGEKMTIRKKILSILTIPTTLILNLSVVFANPIMDSKLATGTEALLRDITTWLLVLIPILGGLLILFFFIRRSGADELDQKKWNNRITTAIISVIGAVVASSILKIVIAYYN